MMNNPQLTPFGAGQPQPQQPAAPAPNPQLMQIGPQVSQALQSIAQNLQQQPTMPNGMPIDRQSPEYKQAMMQQLASTGSMGAAGAAMQMIGDARNKQQADLNAWMPTVTKG